MDNNFKSFTYNGRIIEIRRPLVMGILNVTPDSFYSESRCFSTTAAEDRVKRMLDEGADIIDVGGCSTRPGSASVDADGEYARVARGLEALQKICPDIPVSVDTYRAAVARRAIEDFGAGIINDISGGDLDPEMWNVVADAGAAYILMHTRGTPETMSQLTDYDNVTADVLRNLLFKADRLHAMGVADVILDPGFGFAKTRLQNFELLQNFEAFSATPYLTLAGMSRKRMLYETLDCSPEDAGDASLAAHTIAMTKGADIIRVHDVRPAADAARIIGQLNDIHSNHDSFSD